MGLNRHTHIHTLGPACPVLSEWPHTAMSPWQRRPKTSSQHESAANWKSASNIFSPKASTHQNNHILPWANQAENTFRGQTKPITRLRSATTLHAKTQSRFPHFQLEEFRILWFISSAVFDHFWYMFNAWLWDLCNIWLYRWAWCSFSSLLGFENDRRPVNLKKRENSVQLYHKFLLNIIHNHVLPLCSSMLFVVTSELVMLSLDLVKTRLSVMNMEMRKNFIQVIITSLIEKSPDPKILRAVVKIVEEWVKNSGNSMATNQVNSVRLMSQNIESVRAWCRMRNTIFLGILSLDFSELWKHTATTFRT